MKKRYYQTLLFFVFCFLLSCKEKRIVIEPIKALDTVFSFKESPTSVHKFLAYKVSGYTDNKTSERNIFEFAKKVASGDSIKKYKTFSITFYSSVKESNKIELQRHPDRYYNMDNSLYTFKWDNGKFDTMEKFKDGRLVNPTGKVTITDLP